jgi:hypothetical protein
MMMMHDWTLNSIAVDWERGTATFSLNWAGRSFALIAHDVRQLDIPRNFDWGRGVSVNKTRGPEPIEGGLSCFSIEMQSGDTIKIIAARFDLPATQP